MSVNGRFDDIKRDDFLREADRFGVRSPEKILEEVADALGSFESFAAKAEVTPATTRRIRKSFRGI
jgi:hypothetical protein